METYRRLPPLRVGDEIEYRNRGGEYKTAKIAAFDQAGLVIPTGQVLPQPARIWRSDIVSVKRQVNGRVKTHRVGFQKG